MKKNLKPKKEFKSNKKKSLSRNQKIALGIGTSAALALGARSFKNSYHKKVSEFV